METLIAFALIDFFHVQIQDRANRSTTTRTFVCHLSLNFIITKYLKQEVDDDLSVCVDEISPCSLSVTGDVTCHIATHNGEMPCRLLSRSCFYCPIFIIVAPL